MASVDDFEQGDVLRLPVLPAVALRDGEVGVEDIETATGLVILVSQTCDVVRAIDFEPYLVAAPVIEIEQELYERAWSGVLSPRLFALPALHGLDHPAVDLRLIASVEKSLIEEDVVMLVPPRFEARIQRRFRDWVGRRFARHAFADDLERDILGPLRKRIASRFRSGQADGPLVRALEGVWIGANTGPAVEVVFVLQPGNAELSQLDSAEKIRAAVKALLKPIFTRANETDWKVAPRVVEPSELSAFDLLYRLDELDLDLPRDLDDEAPEAS